MSIAHEIMLAAGLAALGAGTFYELLTIVALLWWRTRRAPEQPPASEAVSVLKPLCGAEPGLHGQLRSFCEQDHPGYEIIFGIRDPADPARAVVERLVREFPALRIQLVIDPQLYGSNLKVSNLINMLRHARHDLIVVSDSDAHVGPDYLARVTAPLQDPRVGLVTSLYRAIPTPRFWSRLGAMYINEWYMPSVLLARMFGHHGYVSGQTMSLRRRTLERTGGLEALADYLAEDHRLGEQVRALGLEVVLSAYPVTCVHHESTLHSMSQHELRWLRTLRTLTPHSFCGLVATFCLPLGLTGLLLVRLAAPAAPAMLAAFALSAVIVAGRLALHFLQGTGRWTRRLADLWLVPLRDLLLVWEWARSFASGRVNWRGQEFIVSPGGLMRRVPHDDPLQAVTAPHSEQLFN